MSFMKKGFSFSGVLLVVFLLLFNPLNSSAQPAPIPCADPLSCPEGCKLDGFTCWDIDDPVPLDNGLLILVASGIAFGVYKLRTGSSDSGLIGRILPSSD